MLILQDSQPHWQTVVFHIPQGKGKTTPLGYFLFWTIQMNLGEVEMLPPKGSLLWRKSFQKIGLTIQCTSGILGWLMKQFWIRNGKGMRFLNPRYGKNEFTFEHLSVEFMYIQNYRRKFLLTGRKTCNTILYAPLQETIKYYSWGINPSPRGVLPSRSLTVRPWKVTETQ